MKGSSTLAQKFNDISAYSVVHERCCYTLCLSFTRRRAAPDIFTGPSELLPLFSICFVPFLSANKWYCECSFKMHIADLPVFLILSNSVFRNLMLFPLRTTTCWCGWKPHIRHDSGERFGNFTEQHTSLHANLTRFTWKARPFSSTWLAFHGRAFQTYKTHSGRTKENRCN